MRRQNAIRFLCSAALMAIVAAGSPARAESASVAAPVEKTFDLQNVSSFSGAFLAARTADVDRDYSTAITLYEKALEFEPANSEIRQRLMLTYFMDGNFDKGVKLADDLKGDPAVERVTSVVRAVAAIRDKHYKTAGTLLKYSGPNDLDRMISSLLAAWAQAGAGKQKEALDTIEKLKGPEWFKIFRSYHAGALALVIGDQAAARKNLEAAVTDREGGATASDTYIRAVMALARLEASQGNKQKALDTISVADGFIVNYAPLKALRESIEKGEPQQQQVTDVAEGAAAVLFSIAGALNREGAEDIVSLYLQASHALDQKSADTLVLLGGLADTLKQPERAIGFYSAVPDTSPMRRISELQLGLALAETGKTDEARQHLKGLIVSDPSDIRSYLAYGSVLSEAKDYAEMADNFDKAVQAIGPVPKRGDWSVFFQRGVAYERLKKWPEAEPNFRKALDLNPEQPQVLNYLGYSWIDQNINLDEGMDMIRRAVELRPNDGYIVDSLGWAHYRLGQFDEAVTELERAIELRAGDGTINDHLGDAYWRVGRKLEATYQWHRALASDSEDIDRGKIQAKIDGGLPPAETLSDSTAKTDAPAPEAVPADKKS